MQRCFPGAIWVALILVGLWDPSPSSAAIQEPSSNPSGVPVFVGAIEGPMPAPGQSGMLAFQGRNDGASDLRIDAAGIRFYAPSGDLVPGVTERPRTAPAVLAAHSTAEFAFDVTVSTDAPSVPITPIGNLFLYNTAVGAGRNLLADPSFEAGDYDPQGLPASWGVGNDPPSQSSWSWDDATGLSGAHAFTLQKTGAGGATYLQQVLLANVLRPNTTYTYSGWVDVAALGGDGWAGLFLFWFDTDYRSVQVMPRLTSRTTGWTYVSSGFTTAAAPVQEVLARGVIAGQSGSTASFDDFSLSEGAVDGAIAVSGASAPPPPQQPLAGDLDGDGKLTLKDVTLALRFAVGVQAPTPHDLTIGDVNGNGRIDLSDVVRILFAFLAVP